MHTNIAVDDGLVADAMRVFGGETEREAVESALKTGIRVRSQSRIRELRGIGWEGDLEEMRLDKPRHPID